jgi:patatin-like phospholipase/acyl hydrolase
MPFLDRVKLVGGSSIGGVNALCLAAGCSPARMVKLYSDRAKNIFKKRDWWDSIAGPGDELYRADYDNDGLREELEGLLGDKSLGDLDKKVLISSFDLDNRGALDTYQRRFWKAKFFHNYDSSGNDKDQLAVDVGLRTSAAPTYFPSYQGYVDGGLVANNPALCALGRAVKSGVPLEEIVILSIGAGMSPAYVEGERLDWGYKQWMPLLMPLFLDGMTGIPDYVCEQLLPNRYVRVQSFLQEDIPLDGVDKVDDLIEWADSVDISFAVDLLASLPA